MVFLLSNVHRPGSFVVFIKLITAKAIFILLIINHITQNLLTSGTSCRSQTLDTGHWLRSYKTVFMLYYSNC